jgi:hypothetical protein
VPESAPREISRALMQWARVVTWVVPICLWLVHIFIITPILNTQSGESKFITAMQFFMLSGLLMIACLLLCVIVISRRYSLINMLPILLNLSWLYYWKVCLFGPTIGKL